MKGDSCYRSVARNFRVVQWLKFNDDMVIIGSIKMYKVYKVPCWESKKGSYI